MQRQPHVEGAAFFRSPNILSPKTHTRTGSCAITALWVAVRWLCVLAGLSVLSACGSRPSALTRISHQCLNLGGDGESTLTVTAPAAGTLLLTVSERGLSVSAQLDTSAVSSSSPVERLGTITLLADTTAGRVHTLRIHGEDSRDLSGQICASAELIPAAQSLRREGEQAFAHAGEAVHAQRWGPAFEGYLEAARRFDHLGLHLRSAQARHAMADLAYRRFDRKRDAFSLASVALEDGSGRTDPAQSGALAALQAKALMDLPGADPRQTAPDIRVRLRSARSFASESADGARELPRLDILLGTLEFNLNSEQQASELYSAAAQRCHALRDWACYGIASQNLALLAEERSNYTFALSVYADALHALDSAHNQRLVADIEDNLGHLQGALGLFSSSERTHAAAMRKYAQLGDCPGFRRTLSRAGSLLVQIGALGDAESDLERAASLDCHTLLSAIDLSSGGAEAGRALAIGSAAVRDVAMLPREPVRRCRHPIAPETLNVDDKIVVFNALLSLGDALSLEGEGTRAQHCIASAGSYAATARAQMRLANASGTFQLEHDEPGAARRSFESTLHIAAAARVPAGNEHRRAAQIGIARAELLGGDPGLALRGAFEALHSSVARGDIDQTIASLRLIGTAYRRTHGTADASHALQVAIKLSEAVPIGELDGEKRATYLATQHTVYSELTDLYASQAEAAADVSWNAFSVSERGRARSLRYAESQQTRDASSEPGAPSSDRYRELVRDIEHLESQPPGTLINALGQAADAQGVAVETIDRTRLSQKLDELGATLVEYASGSHDMFAFVLDSGAIKVVRLARTDVISAAAVDLLDVLRDPEVSDSVVRAAAQKLSRLVLRPLQHLISRRRIIFVPDDALHTIPFAVLPWDSGTGAEALVEHAESVITPSALYLTRPHEQAVTSRDALRIELIGDPVFRVSDWHRDCQAEALSHAGSHRAAERGLSDWTESLPSLPATRLEVSLVAKLARQTRPGSQVVSLLGCAATADALRLAASKGVDLLHIATHARVDAQRPRLSALAFTPEPGSSVASAFGLLDILGLKLHSRLVVLSACDTSRGKLLPGEGVLGPAQAFLQAGSAAVLASYWRIGDETTAAFMRRFYTHLFADPLPAAAALRQAQLETSHVSGPHLWAAFALYGWPDSSL